MTLGLIFNHFFPKTHFGAFSVFHTKCGVIFEDKKIQTQKWCIREKFQHQKLGVTKGFYLVKFFSFLILATFRKNDCSATQDQTALKKFRLVVNSVMSTDIKNMFGQCGSFFFRVSDFFQSTVYSKTLQMADFETDQNTSKSPS